MDDDVVKIYSRDDCMSCRLTKKALEKAGVKFEVIDLDTHPEVIELLRAKGLQSLPVVESRGEAIAGYRPDKLRQLLADSPPNLHVGSPAPNRPATPPGNSFDENRGRTQ